MVSFVDAKEVSYIKNNILNSPLRFGPNKTDFKQEHPTMTYTFQNSKEQGLGQPLPEGKVSFYDNDKNGNLQFVGEDQIKNTAINEEITLELGKNFDVFANATIKDVKKLSERKYKKNPTDRCVTVENMYLYDVSYEITNSGKYDINFTLNQPLNNDGIIVQESIKGQATNKDEHQWNLSIKAGEKATLDVGIKAHLDTRDCM